MKYRKTMLQKLSIIMILLLLCIGVFIACDSDGATEDNADSTSGEASENTDGGESSASNGTSDAESDTPTEAVMFRIADFTLVTPERATDGEAEAFMVLREGINALTGVSLPFSDDWLRSGETHDAEAFEILLGHTNYSETWEVLNETSYGSYTIAVQGNKIIVTAWSEEAIVEGAEVLLEIFETAINGEEVLLVDPDQISATQVVDPFLDYIPVVPNLKMDHIYDANGASEAIYEDATLEHFEAYVEKLSAEGYTQYAENARGNVHSAIFTDYKDYTFNIFYEGGYAELCVVIEDYDKDTLPPKKNDYTKVCDTQFAQLGTEYLYNGNVKYSNVQNGMCYIWRLEDGRFIIMDGGFNYKAGATNLYNTLCEMAVDPDNIEIASWVITHFHGDHAGTLVKFVQNYLFDVTIESLIFNLPTEEQCALTKETWNYWNTISSLLLNYNPDISVYKAHPGQIYHFANAELEILYTLEMTAPDDLVYYNTCSLITDVKFGDFNMMMLGDCSDVTNLNLCNNYGEALESEIVQVAHHGYQGGTTMLYSYIDPINVFWPAGAIWYNTCENNVADGIDDNRNKYFFMQSTRIERVFVAKATVVVFTVEKDTGFVEGWIYEDVNALLADRYTEIKFS